MEYDFETLFPSLERILDTSNLEKLIPEDRSDFTDVGPVDYPDSFIESESLDSSWHHGRHEDGNRSIDTETIFFQLRDPAIAPCLRIL